MLKVTISSLYDVLGSPEARKQFEERLIERLRTRLSWIHKRVESNISDAAHQRQLLDFLTEKEREGLDFGEFINALGDSQEFNEDLADYNKSDWTMVVTILQEIAGDPPDDNQRPDP